MDDIDQKQVLHFNGVGADGRYLFDPLSTEELAQVASGQTLELKENDLAGLRELQWRHRSKEDSHFGVKEGVDPKKLEEAGWGVIFPATKEGTQEEAAQQQILEALKPLLDWRQEQATRNSEKYFQIFRGPRGYIPGETKQKYLARLGAAPGPADPDRGVPYYLLIVASPQVIPYQVQYQIDVQYAVGRIHFDTVEEYANYARSVVAAERGGLRLPQEVVFFGVANPDDPATQMSRQHMIEPLADKITTTKGGSGWKVQRYVEGDATRQRLEQLLGGGAAAPALLYTGSHGMGFKNGDPRQLRQQGALICQDWPGPKQWQKPISEDLYFSADHLRSDANLLGMIAFNFACYGGGSPQHDEFSKRAFKARKEIAPEAFVAGLHKKMLGLPRGGALACIGHVERAWGYSFMWGTGKRGAQEPQLAVFESTLGELLQGMPVGAAMEYFNARYAELSSDLASYIEAMEFSDGPDPYVLAEAWTSNNDARGYAITGDPAVRLSFGEAGEIRPREAIELSSYGPGYGPGYGPSGTPESAPEAPVQAAPAPAPAAESGPAPAPPREAQPAASPSFGLRDGDSKSGDDGPGAAGFRLSVEKVTSALMKALQDGSPLEVRTYASSSVSTTAGQSREALAEAGQLLAFTRVLSNGDIDTVVPGKDGARGDGVDPALWSLHLDLVRQALGHRAEVLKTLLQFINRGS